MGAEKEALEHRKALSADESPPLTAMIKLPCCQQSFFFKACFQLRLFFSRFVLSGEKNAVRQKELCFVNFEATFLSSSINTK